jgi:CubicO group peptidase (beta-lactamase class C family)
MKSFKKFSSVIKVLIILVVLSMLAIYFADYEYILRGARVVYLTGHQSAFIDDYPYFSNAEVKNNDKNIQTWPTANAYNEISSTSRLDSINKEMNTVAFLIIKNDSIVYEDYSDNYGLDSKTNSFSMAKSITTSLLFKAIDDGHIKSLDQPITDFYPDFKGKFANECSVGDLASMASGLNWEENYYSPFSMTAQAHYDDDISQLIKTCKITTKPGLSYNYLSGNTELLAMIIQKAVEMPLADYLSESFWKPLGMRNDALWQMDSERKKMVKAYCCISSNARDFAKFGKLYLDKGNWNGDQLINQEHAQLAIQSRFKESPQYGYGFWLTDYKDKNAFAMRGFKGQYVIGIPEENMIIVRLGKGRNKKKVNNFPTDFYVYYDEALKMVKNDK